MKQAKRETALDVRPLRSVIALAEEAHFARAAKRLGIAQPALSQQIQRLEASLGYPLFVRRPRVSPTDAGAAFIAAARRAVAQIEHGIETATRVARGEAGLLRVGFAPSTVPAAVPRILRSFRHEHADVELRLFELPSASQISALIDGDIDAGFIREPEASDRITLVPVARERYVAALPRRHPLTRRRQVPVSALAGEPFVLFPRSEAPPLYDQILTLFRDVGFTPRVVQEARLWLSILGLVDAGLGVAIVPESFARLKWGDVAYRRLRPLGPWTTTYLCFRNEDAPKAVLELVRTARAQA